MDLITYIEKVSQLERNLYELNLLKNDVTVGILSLRHRTETAFKEMPSRTPLGWKLNALIFAAAGAAILLLTTYQFAFMDVVPGTILGFILGAVFGGLSAFMNMKKYMEVCEEIRRENERIETENRNAAVTKAILEKELVNIAALTRETEGLLHRFYGRKIIAQKYQGLVPACMFHAYLSSGTCNTLEGADGAYARYEAEKTSIYPSAIHDSNERIQAMGKHLNAYPPDIRVLTEYYTAIHMENNDCSTLLEQ